MKQLTEKQFDAAMRARPGSRRLTNKPDGTTGLTSARRATLSKGYSSGRYTYYSVGKSHSATATRAWGGQCFACWNEITSAHGVTEISYHNPLYAKVVSRPLYPLYVRAWDTVIQPCFRQHLPVFSALRKQSMLRFSLRNRAMMEASFYFRLARVFNECTPFVNTAGILRHRYPEHPAAVLLAATSVCGDISNSTGYRSRPHPNSPNETIGGYANITYGMALVRNYEWADRTGEWDITGLVGGSSGAFDRQYHGHDRYWFGSGRYFSVRPTAGRATMVKAKLSSRQFMCPWDKARVEAATPTLFQKYGWDVIDRTVAILLRTYEKTEGSDVKKSLTVPLTDLIDFETYKNHYQRNVQLW